MKIKSTLFAAAAICAIPFLGSTAQAAPEIGAPAPEFKLKDTAGKEHSLSDFKGKFVVLEWVNHGCPFVKKHYDSGNMQKLQKDAADKDVVWLSICSSAEGSQGYYTAEEAAKVTEEKKAVPAGYLLDASGEVGKLYGAKVTPHMFVINPEGVLIYNGAIDSNSSANAADIEGATNYVVETLTAAKAGTTVPNPTTKPYGCSVKYAK